MKRPDGQARQVAYNGRMLYSFKLDSPGEVTGDGFKDAFGGQRFSWHVARSAAVTSSSSTTTTRTPTYTYP